MSGERVRPAAPGSIKSAGLGLVAAFTATTFLSALLLFSIQPLFAKMVLPVLGGAPSFGRSRCAFSKVRCSSATATPTCSIGSCPPVLRASCT